MTSAFWNVCVTFWPLCSDDVIWSKFSSCLGGFDLWPSVQFLCLWREKSIHSNKHMINEWYGRKITPNVFESKRLVELLCLCGVVMMIYTCIHDVYTRNTFQKSGSTALVIRLDVCVFRVYGKCTVYMRSVHWVGTIFNSSFTVMLRRNLINFIRYETNSDSAVSSSTGVVVQMWIQFDSCVKFTGGETSPAPQKQIQFHDWWCLSCKFMQIHSFYKWHHDWFIHWMCVCVCKRWHHCVCVLVCIRDDIIVCALLMDPSKHAVHTLLLFLYEDEALTLPVNSHFDAHFLGFTVMEDIDKLQTNFCKSLDHGKDGMPFGFSTPIWPGWTTADSTNHPRSRSYQRHHVNKISRSFSFDWNF